MGSGAILTEVIKAAQLLAGHGVNATVFSVTSWSELAREADPALGGADRVPLGADTADRVAASRTPYVAQLLQTSQGPIVAATDYVRAVPESIRAFVPAGRAYITLGTDGFGRSDTRSALRAYFGVDAASIAKAALRALG